MIVGIGIMIICGAYYYVWMKLLPRWGKYSIRSEVISVDENGANTHRLLRVPDAEVGEWDATHDELGRKLRQRRPNVENGVFEKQVEEEPAETRGQDISPSHSVTKN